MEKPWTMDKDDDNDEIPDVFLLPPEEFKKWMETCPLEERVRLLRRVAELIDDEPEFGDKLPQGLLDKVHQRVEDLKEPFTDVSLPE